MAKNTKPSFILSLEKTYNITLKPAQQGEDIMSWESRNTYLLNDKNEIIGLHLRDNQIKNISLIKELKQLTQLVLWSCELNDISMIQELKLLTHLYLGDNQINDISHIKELRLLTKLNLSDNQINDISHIKDLRLLTELNLSDNQINDISHIKELKLLTELDLSYNEINDISLIKELKLLTILNLSHTQINDISHIKELKLLTILNLSFNQINDISHLKELKLLTKLDLSFNQINDISLIKGLKPLTILNLRNNQINDISHIKELNLLTQLNLRNNQINDISYLKELNLLTILNLSSNQINDISHIKELKLLTELYLFNNPINDISHIKELKLLTILDIGYNQINDISHIKELKLLTILYLGSNQINDISHIKKLKLLTELDLSSNQINDISHTKVLKQLTKLDLNSNQINDIEPLYHLIDKGVKVKLETDFESNEIVVGDNPLNHPPIEIVEQGNEAILRYFNAIIKEGSDNIYEAKVTLVGEGNAGKTTLLRKLINPHAEPPKNEERTRGIAIEDWKFDKENNNKHVAHIWDFGGQDVYYPVHRFFLTENSVFVLLASTRQNTHEFNYWIPTIFQFGGKSPIILAQTCHDGNTIAWNDIGAYIANDNFNIIKDSAKLYHELNLLNNNKGLDEIKKSIIHQVMNLPHINKIVPKSWIPVRELVKELQASNCIAFTALKEKIQTAQPDSFKTKEDIEDCIHFFHSIGVLLWYQKERKLKEYVILNPKWAVDAVYKIIDDEAIQNQKGIIYASDFIRIWDEHIYEDKHEILKQMLQVFKIAFPKKSNENDYIIPTRLESIPSNDIWTDDKSCLHMEYNFEFMPKGMVNQVSAELSRYIIADNQIWNNAVNLKYERATSQIFEDFYFRRIIVKAKGDDARGIMLLIMNAVKDISDSYKGVNARISIPCPCAECATRDKPEYFEYDELLKKLEKKTNATITCRHSDEVFGINELLSLQGLPNPVKERRDAEERKDLKTIKIFLASSSEMKEEREKFQLYIATQNDHLHTKGIYLKVVNWENYLDEINIHGKQNQLNEEIKDCQIVLCLFFTKVGQFTEDEFDTAFKALHSNSKVKIYTYFKNAQIKTGEIKRDEINSLFDFKDKLKGLGHFIFDFENSAELHNKFKDQLEKYLDL